MHKIKILGIIPARGGSKGIKNKNLIPLCGKPLIQYTIDEVKKSKTINKIIISSDNKSIIDYCKDQDIEVPFVRPDNISGDNASMIEVIKHALFFLEKNEKYVPNYIVLLQPTSPLRKTADIDKSLGDLINSDADSIVSVVKVPHNFNPYSIMKLNSRYLKKFLQFNERKNNRQSKPEFYGRNGPAILAFTYECIMKKNSMYGEKILPYFMEKEKSIDIDDYFDLELAEFLLNKK